MDLVGLTWIGVVEGGQSRAKLSEGEVDFAIRDGVPYPSRGGFTR